MHRGFLRGFLPTGFLIVASLVIGFLVSNFLAEKEGEALPKKNVGTVVTQSMNKEVIPDQKPEKLVKVAEQSPVEIEIHRPAISEKVDSVLKELSDQSAQYSGLELRQRQCDLLLEILQSGKLSCGEKMELCKNVHCSVSDATLSICWNMTFVSASGS